MQRRSSTPPVPRVPTRALAELVASLVVGHIRERCSRGIDIHDRPFAPYSEEYRATLLKLGRNTTPVDMLLSGGLLGSVNVVERTENSVVVGVGTGTSPVVRPRSKRRRSAKQKRSGSTARGPAHNLLAAWHQEGAGDLPRREWFGVSPSGDREIQRQVQDTRPPLRE
jgi:hypothetical protein